MDIKMPVASYVRNKGGKWTQVVKSIIPTDKAIMSHVFPGQRPQHMQLEGPNTCICSLYCRYIFPFSEIVGISLQNNPECEKLGLDVMVLSLQSPQ